MHFVNWFNSHHRCYVAYHSLCLRKRKHYLFLLSAALNSHSEYYRVYMGKQPGGILTLRLIRLRGTGPPRNKFRGIQFAVGCFFRL
jgi:hypothetical protein